MKSRTLTGIDGKTVTIRLPENAADVEKLRKQAKAGRLDDRLSFGDNSQRRP